MRETLWVFGWGPSPLTNIDDNNDDNDDNDDKDFFPVHIPKQRSYFRIELQMALLGFCVYHLMPWRRDSNPRHVHQTGTFEGRSTDSAATNDNDDNNNNNNDDNDSGTDFNEVSQNSSNND